MMNHANLKYSHAYKFNIQWNNVTNAIKYVLEARNNSSTVNITIIVRYKILVILIITYGIIFWGNSPYNIKIFRMQKRIIRIITN
jgi:hypothetical protein